MVAPKHLKDAEAVTGVVQTGWTKAQVEEACGAPANVFKMEAPGVDEYWTYDAPSGSPTQRVQVFFFEGKVTTMTTYPFSDAPAVPTM